MRKPLTQKQKDYRVFLLSPFWQELRAKALVAYPKCDICGTSEQLEAHHISYPDNWYETTLNDLVVLCDYHHRWVHGRFAHSPFDRSYQACMHSFSHDDGVLTKPLAKELIRTVRCSDDWQRAKSLLHFNARMRWEKKGMKVDPRWKHHDSIPMNERVWQQDQCMERLRNEPLPA
jgi:hypothetical protein